MRKWLLIWLIILGTMYATGQNQPDSLDQSSILRDTIVLEDVTVSVLPFGETRKEAAGAFIALNTGLLDTKFALTPTDIINLAPGVHMASGTYNTHRLVIRGIGSRTPYSTNRIRAYLDDIPLTSGDGVSTIEDLDLAGIGIMEILKGPSSALYGSGLGGVIRLNSPYPEKEGFTASVTGEMGSFHTARWGITSSFKGERWVITGGVMRSRSEGYRENSNFARTNLFLNSRFFGRRNTLSFTFSLVDLFARIPSSLNEEDFQLRPWIAAGNWLNVRGHETYLRVLGGFKAESRISDRLQNHLVLFSSFSDPYESRPFNILDDRNTTLGFREYIQYELDPLRVRTGVEYFHEWYQWQIFETVSGTRGEMLSDHGEIRKYANLFALIQGRPNEKVIIDGGVNLNLLRYKLQTHFLPDSTDHTGSYSYEPVVSPRLGISYRHHRDHYLYASAGHGFSAPSLEETLLPEGAINTELKPETGWNLEVGNRGRILDGSMNYDVTLYTIFLHNLLVTERLTEEIFTGANAGKVRNSGLELWMQYALSADDEQHRRNLKVMLGYTLSSNRFTDFVDDGIDYSGNLLPGIPVQKLNSILTGTMGPMELKLHYQHTGSQWMNDANDNAYDAYQLFHLQFNLKFRLHSTPVDLDFHGGIRNLLDTRYASMILVNAPSFGGNLPRYYYPGLPRHFHLGLTFQLN